MADIRTPPFLEFDRPRPTGNVLVTLKELSSDDQLRVLERGARRAGLAGATARIVDSAEVGTVDLRHIEEPVLLRDYGIGLMPRAQRSEYSAGQLANLLREEENVVAARPEFYMFPIEAPVSDTPERTWGIAAAGAEESRFTGKGIRIAILDTGIDLGHPDFQGRDITTRSFIAGESVEDAQGHGTHCAGTAAGPRAQGDRPRYGVAPDAELHVGKVLSNAGSGTEIDILAGMAWAVEAGCEVISMSLGRSVRVGEEPTIEYERIARRALDAGSLIVAAAGNDSSREFGMIAPVGEPANAPSILAVAAVDALGAVARFSCGGINPGGGEVDLAAPGVDVLSSVPRPRLYRALSGTSMACPHVAGLAALWAESDPALRGRALWKALVDHARSLDAPARDVGAGFAWAPGTRAAAGV